MAITWHWFDFVYTAKTSGKTAQAGPAHIDFRKKCISNLLSNLW